MNKEEKKVCGYCGKHEAEYVDIDLPTQIQVCPDAPTDKIVGVPKDLTVKMHVNELSDLEQLVKTEELNFAQQLDSLIDAQLCQELEVTRIYYDNGGNLTKVKKRKS